MRTEDMLIAIVTRNGFFATTGTRRVIMDDPARIGRMAEWYWSTYFPAPSAVNTHHVRLESGAFIGTGFSGTVARPIGSPALKYGDQRQNMENVTETEIRNVADCPTCEKESIEWCNNGGDWFYRNAMGCDLHNRRVRENRHPQQLCAVCGDEGHHVDHSR